MKDKIETLEDLVQDVSFRHWVLKSHPEDIAKWDTWITLNPSKFELVEEAANVVQLMESQRQELSGKEVESKWSHLHEQIHQLDEVHKEKVIPFWKSIYFLGTSVAAVIILLLFFTWIALNTPFEQSSQLTYQTGQGEILHIYLPDSSKVVLHTESKLMTSKHWIKGEDRIVEITGEAYFEVRKLADSSHFKVINQDVVVDVLGTTFMVNGRESDTEVILTSGKVRLTHEQDKDTIFMDPGEVATYAITEKTFHKRKIQNAHKYLDWTQQKFIFDNTSLDEVAKLIEKFYGIEVRIAISNISQKTLSGRVPIDEDFDFILEIIELSFSSIQIDRVSDSSIVIRQK